MSAASTVRARPLLGLIVAVLALALSVGGCGGDEQSSAVTAADGVSATTVPTAAFYATPNPLPAGRPGDLVRAEPMAAPAPGAQAWRVMYLSEGLQGEPVVVTGMVMAPTAPAPVGGRPVVSWAHPTTGIVDACAPSRSANPFGDVQGMAQFLANGWVVVATDYQGLGVDGPHPYLVGRSEAQGTLDIVRTAALLPTGAGTSFMVFGHSQGGQAALFAGQSATAYAPDLTLLGVAAAAPAGELVELFSADKDTLAGVGLGSMAVVSWHEVFGYAKDSVVRSAAMPIVDHVAGRCIDDLSGIETVLTGAQLAVLAGGRMWSADPTTTAPWAAQFAVNTPGQAPIPVPVLVAQGTDDPIVIPSLTAQLVATYAANGTTITEQTMPGVAHTGAGKAAVPFVVHFFESLVAGRP